MVNKNVLELIETKYKVEDVVLSNGMSAWPLLRQAVYFNIQNKELGYSNKLRTRNKYQLFKNIFYGVKNIFRLKKFDYIFFNNTQKREFLNGKLFDIYADAWADRLGQDNSLFIEWATTHHYSKEKAHSQHIISDLILKAFSFFYKPFISFKIKNENVLNEILEEHGINLPYRKIIKSNLAEFKGYRFLFRKAKPKAIFILSSFTKAGICNAAKKLNIPLYEFQHGYIGAGHPFYHAVKKFPEFYPDYLISFGFSEKVTNYKSLIFSAEKILPVGSLQLELIKQKSIPKSLLDLTNKYKICFCVTLQAIKDENILKWIEYEAQIHKNWLFIVRPKQPDFNLSLYVNEKNIMVLPEFSTYEVLKSCDYNISIFSTTVIEGIFLETKPILYNIDGLPAKYFDISEGDIAILEPGEKITEEHLFKKGTFEIAYFEEDYFKNVERTKLCF
ncbi:MAG TPA: hypothetical protein DCS66_09155 [Flavobacteriaceae bacterium]|nr:hypothetical protein [Flavobacteriaceae bacterium]HAT64755.1 hypothetical protein [Flavobacteriaceae bacterium]|tara:strand:- start:158688 stop:160025 length:1338 start_codon:yes stop_codon:yes gene_type:complete